MDKQLSDALDRFKKKNYNLVVQKSLSSGKEAQVYLVQWQERLYALKVYKDHLSRSFQNNQEYLAGKHVHSTSERRAMNKKTKFGKNLMHKLWVKREYYMMKKLFDYKADIPEPIEMVRNAILMQYIGDEKLPAVLLKDAHLNKRQALDIYNTLIKNIDIFYSCGIVHGDLSPFNILHWNEKVYIIDFPQSIDIRNNPNVEELLERDRANIEIWYGRHK